MFSFSWDISEKENVIGFISYIDYCLWIESFLLKDLPKFKDWWLVLRLKFCREWAIRWSPMIRNDTMSREIVFSITTYHNNLCQLFVIKIIENRYNKIISSRILNIIEIITWNISMISNIIYIKENICEDIYIDTCNCFFDEIV